MDILKYTHTCNVIITKTEHLTEDEAQDIVSKLTAEYSREDVVNLWNFWTKKTMESLRHQEVQFKGAMQAALKNQKDHFDGVLHAHQVEYQRTLENNHNAFTTAEAAFQKKLAAAETFQ